MQIKVRSTLARAGGLMVLVVLALPLASGGHAGITDINPDAGLGPS